MKPTMTKFPSVDRNYQSVSVEEFNGGCSTRSTSTYWRFSRDYFNAEAKQHFAGEAACFATIMLMAAVPLISGALAVMQLCRASGGY